MLKSVISLCSQDVVVNLLRYYSFCLCFIAFYIMFYDFVDIFSPFVHGTESRINHVYSRQLHFTDLPTGELVRLPATCKGKR